MKFALFLGCNIPARVQQYDMSARAVLDILNVDLVDIREFNCCGYPIRNTDFATFVLFSARNLALAEKQDLDIVTLCKCCYGSLKKAEHLMKEDNSLRDEINGLLAKEGLEYRGTIEVRHFLSVLHKEIGIPALKEKVKNGFKDLKIATHYGCHALRPSDITQFDNPVAPVLFDQLVELTGAKSIDWQLKLECCGAPLLGVNDDLSMDLAEKKLSDGKQSGADYLCVACPYCQLQFDTVQQMMSSVRGTDHQLPSILFPQLLGLVMGINGKALGIQMNQIDISRIEDFLS
ncbi:MAG: CoB--CoM heterodisulfide reductase iron-sulfur subunit B family protein [Deltaproteobacteria bacterium]|nr:CoB--CoM heterodisulfide reductase iron-sulfur subunit B family protein [Deltaproteobacteria bacterium]MBW1736493.1 CoB--CoM heterodisulfide reductase iron-sulfur subunit B family protein [Deltaproteobacteria bacterium]MBW1909593.1 CoB--CoM heterodisulfide reductase iron-sulfur subunit B family protein [Deltaproteobacteria bacterium]MBW2033506.1 CoB--CoM heterodisulfide reductase iron-sulfur subunit B family protein [Deltaproteobacteria bacterium]MBW2114097.1 CoB--CoM heterodisulfide reducta